MHLIVDGYCGNKSLLTSKAALEKWLLDAVTFISMKTIAGPIVVDYPAEDGDEKGLSGFIILAESNITVHTYPEYNYAFVDVFSCEDFKMEATKEMIRNTFDMEVEEFHLLERKGPWKQV